MAEADSDSSLYCTFCDVGFQETRSYLLHCSSVQHNQKRALLDEKEARGSADEAVFAQPQKNVETEEPTPEISGNADAAKSDAPPPAKKKKKTASKMYDETNFDVYYCKLCDCHCTGLQCHKSHCAGKQHCKKYLVKQNELGFKTFFKMYGNLLYDKYDDKEPPPDVQDDYVIHAYRSGSYNKLNCRACANKLFTFRAWYDHILSEDHGQKMIELLEVRGGPSFMSMYGDLPGPNPHIFGNDDNTNSRQYKFKGGPPRRAETSRTLPNCEARDSFVNREMRDRDQESFVHNVVPEYDRRHDMRGSLQDAHDPRLRNFAPNEQINDRFALRLGRDAFRPGNFIGPSAGQHGNNTSRMPFREFEDDRSLPPPPWMNRDLRDLPAPSMFAHHGAMHGPLRYPTPNNFDDLRHSDRMPFGAERDQFQANRGPVNYGGRPVAGFGESRSTPSEGQRLLDMERTLYEFLAAHSRLSSMMK